MKIEKLSLLRGGLQVLTVKVVGAALSLLLYSIIGRMLGATGSGLFFLALSIATISSTFARAGADNALLKLSAWLYSENEKSRINGLLAISLAVAGALSLIVTIGFLFFRDTVTSLNPILTDNWSFLLVFICSVFPIAAYTLFAQAFQGLHKPSTAMMLITVFPQALTAAACFAFIPLWGPIGAAAAFSAGAVATATLSALWWVRITGTKSLSFNSGDTNRLISSSKPLLLASLAQVSIQWSTPVIAGASVHSSEIGALGVASRVSALLGFIFIAFNSLLSPKFSALFKSNDIKSVQTLAVKGTTMMTVVALPPYIILMLFPSFIMSFFGPDFASQADLLRIMATGQMLFIFFGSSASLLIMSGNEKIYRNILIFIAVAHVVMVALLSKSYGAHGAAYASSIAFVAQNGILAIAAKKMTGVSWITAKQSA